MFGEEKRFTVEFQKWDYQFYFETSPLAPLPSPSHRPGEGDLAEAWVLVGCFTKVGKLRKNLLSAYRLSEVPLSRTGGGRWGGGGGGGGGAGGGGPPPPPTTILGVVRV